MVKLSEVELLVSELVIVMLSILKLWLSDLEKQ